MASPDDLRPSIDHCTFMNAKAPFLRGDPRTQHLVFVRPPIPLEDVGAFCANNDANALGKLREKGDVVFLSASPDEARTQIDEKYYLLDSDYVDVLLVPPLYLIRAKPHLESMEYAVAVRGLVRCKQCRSICHADSSSHHWSAPENYADGFANNFCLTCWLDCQPDGCDEGDYVLSEPTGDLLHDYNSMFELGYHLAILPVARLELRSPVGFPGMVCFYPPGEIELDSLDITPNNEHTNDLAEDQSFASGVNQETLAQHPLVVLPCHFEWKLFRRASHKAHLEFIRSLSEVVDDSCFNLIRYLQCPIEPIHALPGRAGQLNSNTMMSGALLYNRAKGGRIIGGDAFTHIVTRGAGLPIAPIESGQFPKDGEVGRIVRHALSLYSWMIEANNQTAKYAQCCSLLEFLACPGEYQSWKESKKVIARHVAQNAQEYEQLLQRFCQLFGKKDESGESGYRTRIVHMGHRLETVIPRIAEREKLFREMQGYLRVVIKHMIEHSEKTREEYEKIRADLRPFETEEKHRQLKQETDIPF
jgi:hypothetical protein